MGLYSQTRTGVSASNIAPSVIPWVNPNNGAVEDSVYADNTLAAFETTDYLNSIVSAFTIPGEAIFTGAYCEWLGFADVADTSSTLDGYLSTSSVALSSVVSGQKTIPTSPGWGDSGTTIGGDGEMFGLSQAGMRTFVGSKFPGFAFRATEILGGAVNLSCDSMRVTVYYDMPRRLGCLGCGN